MPLCPNGKTPIIEWQYPGEEKNRILGADDYSIGYEPGRCPVFYFIFGTYISRNSRFLPCGSIGYWRTAEARVLPTDFTLINPLNVQPENRAGFYLTNQQNWFIREITATQYNSLSFTQLVGYQMFIVYDANCRSIGSLPVGSNFLTTHLVRADGQPDNCGDCEFKVTKNGQIVYQKTDAQCPTVTSSCDEQCPPNTCECTQADGTVCCYDQSTGNCVKSFKR